MSKSVTRTGHSLGRYDGRPTLEQSFEFESATVAGISDILLHAPLVGKDSIFGLRPGHEEPNGGGRRNLRAFSPAPGYRFDVELAEQSPGVFVVSFAQPDCRSPHLEGDLLWTVSGAGDALSLKEEINTESALRGGLQPPGGARLSLRRWAFFRLGHRQVMLGAAKNIAKLVAD